MTITRDFVAALGGLRPPAAATKSRTAPRSANPGKSPLNFRGALSKQPGPAHLFDRWARIISADERSVECAIEQNLRARKRENGPASAALANPRHRHDITPSAALGLHQNRSPLARIPDNSKRRRRVDFRFLRGGCGKLRRALGPRLFRPWRRLESKRRAVTPHPVRDHRKLPRDRHTGALGAALLGDLQPQGLETAEAFERIIMMFAASRVCGS